MGFLDIIYKCFPVIKWINFYFKIKSQIDTIFNQKYTVKKSELRLDDEKLFDSLNNLNKKELKRKEAIEDKGKSILLILTLTGTILIGTMNFLLENTGIDGLQIFLLFLGIFYLIMSICLILLVINTSMFSDLYLEDTFSIEKSKKSKKYENNEYEISIGDINNCDKLGELIRSIELNQLILLRKANDFSCGLTILKRSFILFFLFICTLGINNIFPNSTTNFLNFIFNVLPF